MVLFSISSVYTKRYFGHIYARKQLLKTLLSCKNKTEAPTAGHLSDLSPETRIQAAA